MENYKDDVAQSRVGCLGSSDGKMLAQICSLGYVPQSAYKRLAVCKGLIPQEEIPQTAAVKAGDAMEMLIYKHLSANDPRYESNPKWVSLEYSKANVSLIAHPDLVLKDDARRTLFVYEVKTTKYTVEETRQTYKAQMFIEYLLAKEICSRLGKDWNVKLFLVHYNTDGLDLAQLMADDELTLDPSRLTVKKVLFTSTLYFDIKKAMNITSRFLETFTEYYEGDEINADMLPPSVRTQFEDVAVILKEIKEREKTVEAFKERLYGFMAEKDIKSISNDFFSISRVDPTESKSFDGKRFLEELRKKHPRKANKILADYTKTTKRKGYAVIKVKERKDEIV